MNKPLPHSSRFFTKKRILLWGLLLLMLFWNAIRLPQISYKEIPLYDFVLYWSAAKAFFSGSNPYGSEAFLNIQHSVGWTDAKPLMMWNPPWVLPFLSPLCLLSFWPARIFWFLLNGTLVLLAADWFWRIYGGPLQYRWISWLAILVFFPSAHSLLLGQISPLILTGLWGFLWSVRKNRLYLAGACTILLSFKPHLLYLFWLFLLLWIFKERAWKVLYGAALFLSALILTVLIINPQIFKYYWTAVLSSEGPQIWETPTWGIALSMIFPHTGAWIRILPSIIGVFLAGWLWHRWKGALDWELRLPLILLLSVVTCTYCWLFDWVTLTPVVVLVLCRFIERPSKRWWIPGALACMLLIFILMPPTSYFYTIWVPPVLWMIYLISGNAPFRLRPKECTL